jgi:hypothetical protein
LNIGRVVGFIGAGAAMPYGRIGWRTLVQAEIRRVMAEPGEAKRHTKRWNSADAERLRSASSCAKSAGPARRRRKA